MSDHTAEPPSSAVARARAEREAARARLEAFLRVPSVSTDAAHADDVRRAAAWLAERLRAVGVPEVAVEETDGHPVVHGQWIVDPDAPTVLCYGHYDVQPPDPLEKWDSPPFEPTLRDGALYARGASDDKGQLLAQVEAVGALAAADGAPPVNLKLLYEGEEEVGSPNLGPWVAANAEALAADVGLITDTAMLAPGQPSIVYGLRGLAYMELTVTGPPRDLHSGQFGGAVRNPANALCEIIAALHDADGRVAIPGFYDDVRPLDDDERAALAKVPLDTDAFAAAAGAAGGWGEPGYSIVERIGARPTLDVNGLWSGWTGKGAKTVLPAEASAKVSMRLVPDQDPDEIADLFASHVRRLASDHVSVEVRSLHGGQPALIDRSLPAMQAAADGYLAAFGARPVFTLEGGTIPVVALFERQLGVPTVLMGFGLPTDNLHAPNEHFRLDNFHRGTEALIVFFERLAAAEEAGA